MAKAKIKTSTDHRERPHKLLSAAIVMFRQFALELDGAEPLEQNFIVTLLIRHCQARAGLDVLEKFGGKPPSNPEKCLQQFKDIAVQLEAVSVIDETFIVNCLQQAWQRKASINIEGLQAVINDANQTKEVVQ